MVSFLSVRRYVIASIDATVWPANSNYLADAAGDPCAEKDALPWRLTNDMSLISSERTLYPVCKFLRKLATEQGIGQLEIEDHELAPRYHCVTWVELCNFWSFWDPKPVRCL